MKLGICVPLPSPQNCLFRQKLRWRQTILDLEYFVQHAIWYSLLYFAIDAELKKISKYDSKKIVVLTCGNRASQIVNLRMLRTDVQRLCELDFLSIYYGSVPHIYSGFSVYTEIYHLCRLVKEISQRLQLKNFYFKYESSIPTFIKVGISSPYCQYVLPTKPILAI